MFRTLRNYIIYYTRKCVIKFRFATSIYDFFFYIKRIIFVKKITKSQLENIEGIKEYNIPINRFYDKKTLGISGVARLKNAEHFLELCIESHMPFLDELILVDNGSTDRTKEICIKLKEKYPKKIKLYEYPFDIHQYNEDNSKLPSNSIHSLAYYYNRCFSKAKYSHVMKVDDDNYLIKEKWKEIREKSLKSKCYNIYYGLNLARDLEGKIGVIKGEEFLGFFGDHGVYPVTPYTYYVQGKNREIFVNNLRYKRHFCSLLHLKFLKPNLGFYNLTMTDEEKNNIKIKYINSLCLYDIQSFIGKIDAQKYLGIIKKSLNKL